MPNGAPMRKCVKAMIRKCVETRTGIGGGETE